MSFPSFAKLSLKIQMVFYREVLFRFSSVKAEILLSSEKKLSRRGEIWCCKWWNWELNIKKRKWEKIHSFKLGARCQKAKLDILEGTLLIIKSATRLLLTEFVWKLLKRQPRDKKPQTVAVEGISGIGIETWVKLNIPGKSWFYERVFFLYQDLCNPRKKRRRFGSFQYMSSNVVIN